MINFHPIEVVDCGSETQLQVDENLNDLILWFKIPITNCELGVPLMDRGIIITINVF